MGQSSILTMKHFPYRLSYFSATEILVSTMTICHLDYCGTPTGFSYCALFSSQPWSQDDICKSVHFISMLNIAFGFLYDLVNKLKSLYSLWSPMWPGPALPLWPLILHSSWISPCQSHWNPQCSSNAWVGSVPQGLCTFRSLYLKCFSLI